jgi:hypothetical protein
MRGSFGQEQRKSRDWSLNEKAIRTGAEEIKGMESE